MPNRREFLKTAAGTAAGAFFQIGAKPGKRRELSIAGRRVKTVDAHAHCFVPEVWDLVKDTPLAAQARGNLTGNIALGNPQRLIDMDAQGIDYQAINVNAWGYSAERALARDLVKLQNEKISEWCAKHPDRFVGMATVALQHPDLAADQLDEAVKKKPSEYFKQQLYIDTMIFHEEGLRHLVAEVGVDHMVYGTDYPFDWPVGIDFVLNAPFLNNAQKEAILSGNLIKLLRITS